jgi:sugar phosphate isomerase/epimerase
VQRSPLFLAAGCALDVDARTLVEAAAQAGFDGVGLRLSHDHALEVGALAGVGALLREHGLRLHDAEVHRISDATPDPAPLIDAAAALGASHVLVVSDLADDAQTIDQLGRFAQRCRAAGMTAALEYMAWTNPRSSAGAIRMAEAADSVIVVDLLHHHRLGEGVDQLRDVVASGRLGWVQLCDAPAESPDGHDALIDEARHRRLPPGEGRLPLSALLQAVPAGTPISVEVQSDVLARLPLVERAALLHRTAAAVLAAAHDPSSTG